MFDVHVQNAPVLGRIAYFKHSPGQYLNAMRADCSKYNENVLIGIEAGEPMGEKIGVRLIAGLIARRIVPWIAQNDIVQRGERISLIQFGSRVDVYLPHERQNQGPARRPRGRRRIYSGRTRLNEMETKPPAKPPRRKTASG